MNIINKNINKFLNLIIGLTIFITIFMAPIYGNKIIIDYEENGQILWPSLGYYNIIQYFGSSSYHKGIDIEAPPGSPFIAVTDGTITFIGFLGGGGYTITLTDINQDIKYTYCHVDPNFIVFEGEQVSKGQIIGYVGPKNVYGVQGNQYFDTDGNPTNGSLEEPHLHFGIRVNDNYVNPLNYYNL